MAVIISHHRVVTVNAVYETDADLAIAAARAGAAVARERYGTPLTRYAKSGIDFATEVDLEAEEVIKAFIRSARPNDAILGEEFGIEGSADAARTWLVDPLCGTANYVAQTPLAAVNVALRVGQRVAAAAAADPFAGEIFWTGGAEAFVRRDDTDTTLAPDVGAGLVELNLDPPYPNGDWFAAARLLDSSRFRGSFGPRVLSTTLALTWVAAGRRAAYVTDGHLRDSVHFAAGIALCQAARCQVTDLRGFPVHTGVGGLIAAADEETHAALVTIIADYWWARP
jgi:myo-inositol-1(or 4)-monophosphatase